MVGWLVIALGLRDVGLADVGHQPVNGQYLDLEHGAGAFRMGVDCRCAGQGAHLRTANP